MTRFIGRYEHSLDNKGRVILPAKYRPSFDTHAFVSQHHDKCLALWTPEEFEKQLAEMESTQGLGPIERNNARIWASGSVEVEMDRQGRVALPNYLRVFAGLEEMQPLLITGALNRIEFWNPREWAARVQPSEANFTTSPSYPATVASDVGATVV